MKHFSYYHIGFLQLRRLFLFTPFFILAIGTSCSRNKPKPLLHPHEIGPGTQGMVAALEALHQEYGNDLYFARGPQRTHFWDRWFEDDEDRIVRDYWKADFLLRDGKNREAIAFIDSVMQTFDGQAFRPIVSRKYNELLAIAWLRLGETENCIQFHSSESCIMPVQGKGIHQLKEGSRNAIKIYSKLLKQDSSNLKVMFLMNIAYQTLGTYPDSVPEEFLIPLSKDSGHVDAPTFKNIAGNLGLNTRSHAGGAIMEDFNNDGYLDIMLSGMHLNEQLELYINNGDGSFTESSETAGLKGITGGLNIIQADYNNDDFKDVLVLRGGWYGRRSAGYQPNSLLKNLGDGTFTDVTVETGLLSLHPCQTATWADFNNDGWLDLLIGNESEMGNHPSELFINLEGTSFKEMASDVGINVNAHVKGVTAADYNGDGWQDIFISTYRSKNYLFTNQGSNDNSELHFQEDTIPSVTENEQTFPCWFWDYNNDGHEDLMVFRYRSRHSTEWTAKYLLGHEIDRSTPTLYKNDGKGSFAEVTDESQLKVPATTMGCNFGDVNNDGLKDVYIGTGAPSYEMIYPNRLLINSPSGKFYDATTVSGTGHLQKGHGIAIGDLDNDGDQDILAEMGGFYKADLFQNALFLNPGNENNWIKLELEGVTSNRDAIGSKIKITLVQDSSTRTVHHTISCGSSFGSNSFRADIGLGAADSIQSVEVFWPTSNTKQVFTSVAVNHSYKIKEDGNELTPLHLPTIRLNDSTTVTHQHHHVH